MLRTAAGDLLQDGCEYLLILKKSRAFIQRNSWGVIWSQPNSWERCRILTHWLYILDLCIRYLAQQDAQCIGRKTKELLVWCVGVDKLCLAQKPSLAWNIPTAEGECWQQWTNVEHRRGKFFKIPPCDLLCLEMDDYLGFARFVWPSAFLKNDCIDSPYSAIQKGHEAEPWALREEECFCLLLCLVIVLKLLCLSPSKTSPSPRWWCIREKSSGARSIHFSLFLLSLADRANWKLELKSLRSVWPSSSHPIPAPVAAVVEVQLRANLREREAGIGETATLIIPADYCRAITGKKQAPPMLFWSALKAWLLSCTFHKQTVKQLPCLVLVSHLVWLRQSRTLDHCYFALTHWRPNLEQNKASWSWH